jgi:hypothetical protein
MTRLPLALALLLLAPAAAQAEVTGAVGGLRDPATGYLDLTVQASDRSGSGLRSVSASLGGKVAATTAIGAPGCLPDSFDVEQGCPATGEGSLLLDTTEVADGPQRIVITAEDGNGAQTTLVDRDVMVANTLPTWTSTVTIDVGSGSPDPDGGGPTGPSGDPSGGGVVCRAPRLSVTLATRPLRFRHGVPVLRKGKRYTFKGRLTCVVDGRRRVAPRGSKLELRQIQRGRTVGRRTLTVGANGQLRVRITARSRRAIVFRFRATGGKLVRVRIPVSVARKRAVASAAQDPGTEVGGTVPSFLGLSVDASDPARVRARVTTTLGAVLLRVADDPILAAFRAPVANEAVAVPVRRGDTIEITLSVAGP